MTIALTAPGTGVLDAVDPGRGKSPGAARIAGVATATTEHSYTQREVLDLFAITDPKVRSVFLNSAIERRFLTLPPRAADGALCSEAQGELLAKHKRLALDMGGRAVRAALDNVGLDVTDVDYVCCTTTTGFLTPGLSAHLIRDLGIPTKTSRVDVVGMGCNAGVNALNATASWAIANPGKVAVMLCTEACSAAYVIDDTLRTAVVNSLFGDGAAAIVLMADAPETAYAPADVPAAPGGPRILGFSSHLITDAIGAMRYDWDDEQGKFSFYLDPQVPYVVGANAEQVVDRLLNGAGLRRSEISHWLVHSGGKKVIDAVRVNLGLTRHDVRHTTGVLRDYGNLSSGSFLFSYERLLREGVVQAGDYGVLMAMGPGSTIETALVQW
ncbi:3-oxoacyl-[acyl-carrier-protein] synthase III C-terminal domain-containing protein [Streptomyces paradoxus]|uniref:Putative naringenin-chalcone synthase n=1 Tax=Streptomyces paradoxus TaxID=66375 RepID=A0A7W9TIL8_9ACTN|nr:3,5-dihydroxyphenylacetyl-CoA synthase DpgA [Streptomyces paradoxus]MBB6081415.1 putative naringenin-chalcone synthase [Streptomyces paradoxus]